MSVDPGPTRRAGAAAPGQALRGGAAVAPPPVLELHQEAVPPTPMPSEAGKEERDSKGEEERGEEGAPLGKRGHVSARWRPLVRMRVRGVRKSESSPEFEEKENPHQQGARGRARQTCA